MPAGNGRHDGETESAAAFRIRLNASPVEAVEDALTFLDGNPLPGIGDLQNGTALDDSAGHIHAPSWRRVAQSVADQVGKQDLQRTGVAGNACRFVRIDHAKVDSARIGQSRIFGDAFAHQQRQTDITDVRLGCTGLLPGERQHLLDRMRRAMQTVLQLAERRIPFVVRCRTFHQLRLQLQGRQRRAQFVRRIGDKRALRIQRRLQADQQII